MAETIDFKPETHSDAKTETVNTNVGPIAGKPLRMQTPKQEREEFTRLEKNWGNYIWSACVRYSMEQDDTDELYQDGLLIMHNTRKEFDPDTIDFGKMFKTQLFHHFSDYVDKCKAGKRDVRMKVSMESFGSNEDEETGETHSGVLDFWHDQFNDEFESTDYIDNFKKRLSERELLILTAQMNPPVELEHYWETQKVQMKYEKDLDYIPQHIIASFYDMSSEEVSNCLRRIKQHYIDYTGDKSLERYMFNYDQCFSELSVSKITPEYVCASVKIWNEWYESYGLMPEVLGSSYQHKYIDNKTYEYTIIGMTDSDKYPIVARCFEVTDDESIFYYRMTFNMLKHILETGSKLSN